MLTRDTFEQGWATLCTRFTGPKAAKEGYYTYLGPRMTDKQFQGACGHLFAHSARFPKPHDFVEAAPEAELESWGEIRTWKCEDCGGVGRSLGPPRYFICTACVRIIGRERLRRLKQDGVDIRPLGGAIAVGMGVIHEDRAG